MIELTEGDTIYQAGNNRKWKVTRIAGNRVTLQGYENNIRVTVHFNIWEIEHRFRRSLPAAELRAIQLRNEERMRRTEGFY